MGFLSMTLHHNSAKVRNVWRFLPTFSFMSKHKDIFVISYSVFY